jgi:hypothetical protein
VGADRGGVHAQLGRAEGDLAEGLHRVGVQHHPPPARAGQLRQSAGHLGHGLQGSGFVVHQHEGHQGGVRVHRAEHPGRIHPPAGGGRHDRRLPAQILQAPGRQEQGVVLQAAQDHPLPAAEQQKGEEHQVVGLRAPGSEHHLLRRAAQAIRQPPPAVGQQGGGLAAGGVR